MGFHCLPTKLPNTPHIVAIRLIIVVGVAVACVEVVSVGGIVGARSRCPEIAIIAQNFRSVIETISPLINLGLNQV